MSELRCNECGSTILVKGGWRRRKVFGNPPERMWFQQWRCKICGKSCVPDGSLPIDRENKLEGK